MTHSEVICRHRLMTLWKMGLSIKACEISKFRFYLEPFVSGITNQTKVSNEKSMSFLG